MSVPPPVIEPPTIDQDQLDAHRAMVLWLFLATLVLSAAFAVSLWMLNNAADISNSRPPILLIVVVAGALGGFVSCLRRLYAFEDLFPKKRYASLFKTLNVYLIAFSTIPPMVGMIAAAFIYVVFAAQLLRGSLFPEFHCVDVAGNCESMQGVLKYWAPKEAFDFCKAIVWGFISGFSESFVVDILKSLGDKAKSQS